MQTTFRKKALFTLGSLLSIIGYGVFVFAAPPSIGGYSPGEILDPECAPNAPDCIVALPGGGSGWGLTGNSSTDADTNFIGTTDAQDFVIKTNGNEIARFGQNGNVAIGSDMTMIDPSFVLPNSSGTGSVAFQSSVSSGFFSTAFAISQAIGDGAMSWGFGVASNDFTTAWGGTEPNYGAGPTASGYGATAFGGGTVASGGYSVAFGQGNFARSNAELAFGFYNTDYTPFDSGLNQNTFDRVLSIGIGNSSGARKNAYTLWKDGSFAYNDDNFQNDNTGTEQNMFYFNYGNHDGLGSVQTKRAIRLGSAVNDEWDINSANVGNKSVAIGFGDSSSSWNAPIATGFLSMAFGTGAQATGDRATALGYFNKASGISAFAAGNGAEASGYSSVSIGYSSISSGLGSFAANSANASGDGSFAVNQSSAPADSSFSANRGSANSPFSAAFGYDTDANGNYSFAGGSNSTAYGPNSFAFGLNAKAFSSNEIALGVENTSYTPTETVSDRLLVVGNDNSDAFTILKNGKTGIGYDNFETTSLAALLQVNGSINQTGAIGCALESDANGEIICAPSDQNLKQNISDITYGLDTITALRPVSYTFKNQSRFGSDTKIGFLAQDLQQVVPELVSTTGDYLSVNYGAMTPVLVKAIQEMNLNITNLSDMTRSNTWRDSLIAWFGNVENGITDLFAKRAHVEQLCIGTINNETCLTKDQVDTILNSVGTVFYQAPVVVPTSDPAPTTPDQEIDNSIINEDQSDTSSEIVPDSPIESPTEITTNETTE
jgi:hypothetical protein